MSRFEKVSRRAVVMFAPSVWRKLVEYAESQEESVGEIIRRAVESYMKGR